MPGKPKTPAATQQAKKQVTPTKPQSVQLRGVGPIDVTFNNGAGKKGWSWQGSDGKVITTNSAATLAESFGETAVKTLRSMKASKAALKQLQTDATLHPDRLATGDGSKKQIDCSSTPQKELSASSVHGSAEATTPQVPKRARAPAPAPASAPASAPGYAMPTVTVAKPPDQPESKDGDDDDDDVSSQLGLSVPDTDAVVPAQKAVQNQPTGGGNASIENGVGKQALQQQNEPSPLAQENAAPTGFQGAAPAPAMRSAPGPSNVIHKVAVQRISAAKGIPFETYRQAFMQSNGAEVESMSDNELYQSSVDLCDQGIDTVKIKKPRFTSGRANLIREFIELNVLYNMAKPKEAEQGSKLAMLLDASNMGISAEHMMQALKGSVGGADGHIKQNAAVNPTTLGSTGPPAGSAQADAAFTMGDTPNALNVKNTASYTSTTMHGKRIDREFIMDRLRFDNNFSQDTPITETTFHFKKKKPESKKLIRF